MAEEKKEKVKDADVLRVLAKHATGVADPDDQATLTQFNQQKQDEQQGTEQPESDAERGDRSRKEEPSSGTGVKPTGQRPGSSGKEGGGN